MSLCKIYNSLKCKVHTAYYQDLWYRRPRTTQFHRTFEHEIHFQFCTIVDGFLSLYNTLGAISLFTFWNMETKPA